MMDYPELDLQMLKTITNNKRYALEFVNDCNTNIFSPDIWRFANAAVSYIKLFQEVPTRRVMLENTKEGSATYDYYVKIWDLLDKVKYDDKEFKFDLVKLKNQYAARTLLSVKKDVFKDDSEVDVTNGLKSFKKAVQEIESTFKHNTYARRSLKDSIPFFHDTYKAKHLDPVFGRGILTGFSYLDFILNGIKPSELMIIGAESGGGKSMLLMNMAVQMWMQNNTIEKKDTFGKGYNVMYFSLEMPHDQCLERIVACMSDVPQIRIRDAALTSEHLDKVDKALKFIKRYPQSFEVIDSARGTDIGTIELLYNDAKASFTPDLIVIDYLGLMELKGGESLDDWLKLGKIAEQIHEFARVYNIPILTAAQLNRKGNKSGEETIGMHRIGRSAMIMHNANFGIQIEQRPNEDQFPDMYCHIIKNRRGPLGKFRLLKNFGNSKVYNDPGDGPINHDTIGSSNPDDLAAKLEQIEQQQNDE